MPSTSTVVGYKAYSSTVAGGPYTALTASPVPMTSYVDSTVDSGQTYFYVVTAVDSDNLESTFSNEVSVTVPADGTAQ
jgi:fibronectin type 3 domain-containing protein